MTDGKTNIEVTDEVWSDLNARKRPGETFDDVLRRLTGLDDRVREHDAPEPDVDIGRSEAAARTDAPSVRVADDLPQRVDVADAGDVVERVLELIDERGPIERTAIVEELDESYSLGYDGWTNRKGAWWRRIVKPSLQENGCQYRNGAGWSR